MLGSDRRTVSTPGVKERAEAPRGCCRPAEEEEAGAYEARTSARTAKVQELQQQIRDLAAQLAEGARKVEAVRRDDGSVPGTLTTARLPQSIVPSKRPRQVRCGGAEVHPRSGTSGRGQA